MQVHFGSSHFGSSFEADCDRTVSVAPPKPKCSDDEDHYCRTVVLGPCCRLTSEGQRPGCDPKDAECLDEKQVLFQLLFELHDSKDSDPGVHAGVGGGWRRRYHPYYYYGSDGWSPQQHQHPHQHRDHPSLQCEQSPSWVERHECRF